MDVLQLISTHEKVAQQFLAQLPSTQSAKRSSIPLVSSAFSVERTTDEPHNERRGHMPYRRPSSANVPLSRVLTEEKKKKKKEQQRNALSKTTGMNQYWLGAAQQTAARSPQAWLHSSSSSVSVRCPIPHRIPTPTSGRRVFSLPQWRLFVKRRASLRRRARPTAWRRHIRRAMGLRIGKRTSRVCGHHTLPLSSESEGHGKHSLQDSARDGLVMKKKQIKKTKNRMKNGKKKGHEGWCWLPSHLLCRKRLQYRRLRRVVVWPMMTEEKEEHTRRKTCATPQMTCSGPIATSQPTDEEEEEDEHRVTTLQQKPPLHMVPQAIASVASSPSPYEVTADGVVKEPVEVVRVIVAAPTQRLGKHHRVLQRWVQQLQFPRASGRNTLSLLPRRGTGAVLSCQTETRKGREGTLSPVPSPTSWGGASPQNCLMMEEEHRPLGTSASVGEAPVMGLLPPCKVEVEEEHLENRGTCLAWDTKHSPTRRLRRRTVLTKSSTAIQPPTSLLMDLSTYCMYALTWTPTSEGSSSCSSSLVSSARPAEEVTERDKAAPTFGIPSSVTEKLVEGAKRIGFRPDALSSSSVSAYETAVTTVLPTPEHRCGPRTREHPNADGCSRGGVLHGYMRRSPLKRRKEAGTPLSTSATSLAVSTSLPNWVPCVLLLVPFTVEVNHSPGTPSDIQTTGHLPVRNLPKTSTEKPHEQERTGIGIRTSATPSSSSLSASFFFLLLSPDPVVFPSPVVLARRGVSVSLISLWSSTAPSLPPSPSFPSGAMLLGSLFEWWWQPPNTFQRSHTTVEVEGKERGKEMKKGSSHRKRQREEAKRETSAIAPRLREETEKMPHLREHRPPSSREKTRRRGEPADEEREVNSERKRHVPPSVGSSFPLLGTTTPAETSSTTMNSKCSPRPASPLHTVASLLQHDIMERVLREDVLTREKKNTTPTSSSPSSSSITRMMIVFPSLLPPFSLEREARCTGEGEKKCCLHDGEGSPSPFASLPLSFPTKREKKEEVKEECVPSPSSLEGKENPSLLPPPPDYAHQILLLSVYHKKEEENVKEEEVYHCHFAESRRFFSKLLGIGKRMRKAPSSSSSSRLHSGTSRMEGIGDGFRVWSIGEKDRENLLQALGRPVYPLDYGYDRFSRRPRKGKQQETERNGAPESRSSSLSSSRSLSHGMWGLAAFGSPYNAHRRLVVRALWCTRIFSDCWSIARQGIEGVAQQYDTEGAEVSLKMGKREWGWPFPWYRDESRNRREGRLPVTHTTPGCRLLRLQWRQPTTSGTTSMGPHVPGTFGKLEMCGIVSSHAYFMRRLGSMVAPVWLCIPQTSTTSSTLQSGASTTSSFCPDTCWWRGGSSTLWNTVWVLCDASTAKQLLSLHCFLIHEEKKGENTKKVEAIHHQEGDGKGTPEKSEGLREEPRCVARSTGPLHNRHEETRRRRVDHHVRSISEEAQMWETLYNTSLCTWVEPVELFG